MRLVVPGCVSDARAVPALRVLVLAAAMALYLSMGESLHCTTTAYRPTSSIF